MLAVGYSWLGSLSHIYGTIWIEIIPVSFGPYMTCTCFTRGKGKTGGLGPDIFFVLHDSSGSWILSSMHQPHPFGVD